MAVLLAVAALGSRGDGTGSLAPPGSAAASTAGHHVLVVAIVVLTPILAVLGGVFFVYVRLAGGVFIRQAIPPGWASLIVSVVLFSGIQLCVLGMIGEYIGRIYGESKHRPLYVVRERMGFQTENLAATRNPQPRARTGDAEP